MDCACEEINGGPYSSVDDAVVLNKPGHYDLIDGGKIINKKVNSSICHEFLDKKLQCLKTLNNVSEKQLSTDVPSEDIGIINCKNKVQEIKLNSSNTGINDNSLSITSLLENSNNAEVTISAKTPNITSTNISKSAINRNLNSKLLDKDICGSEVVFDNQEKSFNNVLCSIIDDKQSDDLKDSDQTVVDHCIVKKSKESNVCGIKIKDLANKPGKSQAEVLTKTEFSVGQLTGVNLRNDDKCFIKSISNEDKESDDICEDLTEKTKLVGVDCATGNLNSGTSKEKQAINFQIKKTTVKESSVDEISNASDDIDIKEFKLEENETDDEIDSLLADFVDFEYANNDKDISKLSIILSDSEVDMDSVIEAFKADDSEDDCLIIEDDSKEILLNDDKPDNVNNELPPAKIIKNLDSCKDPKDCSKEKMIESSLNDSSASNNCKNIEKSIKFKVNDSIFQQKIKETPIGIYLKSNADECDVVDITDEDKELNNSLSIKSQDNMMNDKESKDGKNSKNVLDLINENLDSIVSLINDSNVEETAVEDFIQYKISHKDTCKVDSCNECSKLKNIEESSQVNDNSPEIVIKELLSSMINQLTSSDYSDVAISDEHKEMDIFESEKFKLLNDSSDSGFSLNSHMETPASCPELDENVDKKDVKVSLQETSISGLFSQCNDVDKKENVRKNFLKADFATLEPVADVKTEENKKPIKSEIKMNEIDQKLLMNGDLNNSEKKRRLENDESSPENEKKKFKDEKFEITDSSTEGSLEFCKINEMVSDFLENKSVNKFETNKNWLDKIAYNMCWKTVHDTYLDEMDDACDLVQALEKTVNTVTKEIDNYRTKAGMLCASQNKAFNDFNFNPKVQTRTVGVNVKIFRECDLRASGYQPSTSSNSTPLSAQPQSSSLKVIPSEKAKSLLSTQPKATIESLLKQKPQQTLPLNPSKAPLQTQQSALMTPVARAISNINTPRTIVSSSPQKFISPNVTVAKNGVMLTSGNSSNVMSHNTTEQQQKPSNQLIDLTSDEPTSSNKSATVSSTNVPSTTATVAKVNLPSPIQRSNILLPLSNVVHMLPTTPNRPFLNQGRQMVPPIPSNVIGQRTLGYIVTTNANNPINANTVGVRGNISAPTLLPNKNQPLQTTILVRMTNPSTSTPLSTLVNNTPRMPAVPQTSSATSSLPSSPGLVLFPHTPCRHPAPFPRMPTYPHNPQWKSLPPKPDLKCSRSNSGIILSWNMRIHNLTHADIASYQIFAYQETNGPVTPALWKNVGNVNALQLPMACTLRQFNEGHRYYFTVRAVDCHGRFGSFSVPVSILYSRNAAKI